MTRQRRVILEVLLNTCSHPSAGDVYKLVRRKIPRISLGTVYRGLEALVEQGLIQKIKMVGQPMRFDATTEKHHHVRCIRCNKVADVPFKAAAHLVERAQKHSGYKIVGCKLEFLGLCPRCQKKEKRNDGKKK